MLNFLTHLHFYYRKIFIENFYGPKKVMIEFSQTIPKLGKFGTYTQVLYYDVSLNSI